MGNCPKWNKSPRITKQHQPHDSKINQLIQFMISKVYSATDSQLKIKKWDIDSSGFYYCI